MRNAPPKDYDPNAYVPYFARQALEEFEAKLDAAEAAAQQRGRGTMVDEDTQPIDTAAIRRRLAELDDFDR